MEVALVDKLHATLDGCSRILIAHADASVRARAALPDFRAATDERLVDGPHALAGQERTEAALAVGMVAAGHEAVIARLRDVVSPVVLALEPDSADVACFRALGFNRLHRPAESNGWWLFGFRLDSYKRTPDWLNARFWANPDRWDTERW